MTAGNPAAIQESVNIRLRLRDSWMMATRMSNDGDPATQRSVNEAVLRLIELAIVHDIHMTRVVKD